MALYIAYSIFHLARLLYVRPETFGPYYVEHLMENKSLITRFSCILLVYIHIEVFTITSQL